MKKTIKICCTLFCVMILLTFSAFAENVSGNNFTDLEKEAQREAGFEVWKQVNKAAKSGESYIRIPPGDYRVNNRIIGAFIIDGAKNLHIDAQGAVFWSDTNESIFKIRNSSGCKINGLTIDYDPIGAIQGTVTAVNNEEKTFDILLDDGCPIPNEEWNSAAESGKMKALFFDESGEKMIEGSMDYTNSITQKADRTYTIGLKWGTRFSGAALENQKIKVGMRYVSPWRRSTTIELKDSDNMTFEDITIYGASGFAIGENYGEGGNTYRRINLIRRPGTDRLLAANADGIHSGGVKKGPLIENCTLSYAGDDLLNIRGFYDVVLEKETENTFIIGVPEERLNFAVGSQLRFFSISDFTPEGSAEVAAIEEYSGETANDAAKNIVQSLKNMGITVNPNLGTSVVPFKCYRVTLSSPIENADVFSIVDSKDYCGSGAIVRNNVFNTTVTAGARIRNSNAVIENNTFNRCGECAIVVRGERYWMEGGFSENVLIKNNTVTEACCLNPSKDSLYSAAISVSASVDYQNSPQTAGDVKNIAVIGNRISKSYAQAALLWDIDNLVFAQNTVESPFYSSNNAGKFDNYGVWIKNCSGLFANSNIYNNIPDSITAEKKEKVYEDGSKPLIFGAEVKCESAAATGRFKLLSGANSAESCIRASLKNKENKIVAQTALKGGAAAYSLFENNIEICLPNADDEYTLSVEAAEGTNILWKKDFDLSH